MVAMMNTFRRLFEANRPICKPLFNDVNHRLAFETFWVTDCYLPSRDNRRAIIGRLEAGLSENQLVEKVCVHTLLYFELLCVGVWITLRANSIVGWSDAVTPSHCC